MQVLIRQANVAEKYMRLLRLYCCLVFSLWSVLLRPTLQTEKHTLLTSFWPFQLDNEFIYVDMRIPTFVATIVYSTLALVSFYDVCTRTSTHSRNRNMQRQTMVVKYGPQRLYYKYFWLCLVPWLFVYALNWAHSVGTLLLPTLSATNVHTKNGLFLTLSVIYIMQGFVFKEVFCHMFWGLRQMLEIDERLAQRHHAMLKLSKSGEHSIAIEHFYVRDGDDAVDTRRQQHTDGGGDADISAETNNDGEGENSAEDDFLRYSVGDGWGFATNRSSDINETSC